MTGTERDLLKWLGVFFRKPTPGRFMMRVRMPNGMTNARQLRAIADLSRRMGNCVVDITTRQQLQVARVHAVQPAGDLGAVARCGERRLRTAAHGCTLIRQLFTRSLPLLSRKRR
jgi:sulfite reductase beta subunit-like hemoprotein